MENNSTKLAVDFGFKNLIEDFALYVGKIESQFASFDERNSSIKARHEYLIVSKSKIFQELDSYFVKIWRFVSDLDSKEFLEYQVYLLESVKEMLLNPIEINKYIHDKPLRQPGDYVMLNYIYDYFGNLNFLGKTTFQKLINNYTCNIPIAYSNNLRKTIFKEKIITVCSKTNMPRILSFGCGAAREVIEISNESLDIKLTTLDLFESQPKALIYIKDQINTKNSPISPFVNFQVVDYVEIIRKTSKANNFIYKYDLIYCPGIFDYLTKRMAQKLLEYLFQYLNHEGQLIICNANKKSVYHRAYYEMIGGWNFIHRDKEEMLEWVSKIDEPKEIYFSDDSQQNCYSYLNIIRK